MLLRNRLFERQPPSREAKSIYIFCEGAKREYQYFKYFIEMDSRINVEVYKLNPHENNSPIGLLTIAKACILLSDENQSPKYNFQENDEVWIIVDVDKDKEDSRRPQIQEINTFCNQNKDWFVAQSNPCFEVWLYYHLFENRQSFEEDEKCSKWKSHLNDSIQGGFDSRRHPIFIQNAVENSKSNFESNDDEPLKGCTEVHGLGESMLIILKEKIDKVLKEIGE